MKRLAIALGLALVATAQAARADDAPPPGCAVASADPGAVTIGCAGLTEALGKQLAEVLTRILQNRLDPQMVIAKLDEVDRVAAEGVARTVDENQRYLIIQNLLGKPAAQIAITAHPAVEDGAEFAQALATPLLMVGWQIEGNEIRRVALKSLEPVHGLALVVHDRGAAPPKALQLKAALAAAHITAPLVSDRALMPDAALLWVGRRPEFTQPEAAK